MSVRQEIVGRVLIIRMERGDKCNAIDSAIAKGIDAALNRLDDDPELWVGIITGTDEVFSAGTDLANRADLRSERGGEYGMIRRRRSTPLIAAVEGAALGGGFEIALACDLIVASRTARFGHPECRRGLVAMSGGLFRAARSLPPNVARELLIAGRLLGAERAQALGLVTDVTEPGHAVQGALELAHDICRSSPMAVRETLHAMQTITQAEEVLGWTATDEAIEGFLESEDMHEGVAAFFEKRAPRWRGR